MYSRISGVSNRQHRKVKKLTTYKEWDLGQVSNSVMNLSLFIFTKSIVIPFRVTIRIQEESVGKCFVMLSYDVPAEVNIIASD